VYLGDINNKVMTEEIFKELEFEYIEVLEEESGANPFHYYSLYIGDICLISNTNDEADTDGWYCSIFDSMTLQIKGEGDLRTLVDILKLNS
jgi:hypothetical protein